MTLRRTAWLAVAFICTALNSALAQRPRGADTLSAKAVSDSQAVLTQLAARIKSDNRDTAAWFRTGLVAWALYERARAANPPRGIDPTRLGRMADSSLRIAADLAQNDAVYQLTIGDFLIASGVPSARAAAGKYYETALDAARKGSPDELRSRAALELGRVAWRRYDALANRRQSTNIGDIGRSLSDAMQPIAKGEAQMEELAQKDRQRQTADLLNKSTAEGARFIAGQTSAEVLDAIARAGMPWGRIPVAPSPTNGMRDNPGVSLGNIRSIIETQTFALPPSVSGASDFMRADTLFNEAYSADPTSAAAFRAVAMWLVEKKEWVRLEAFARAHIERNRSHGPGWMALGLALHRQAKTLEASQVFDTSMMAFDAEELRRLDSPSHTLPPSRASRVDATWATNRNAVSYILWQSADPMWSDGLTERRTEFRARVAYAELRWTVEEEGIKGASTDRGDIFIRYGPPDLIAGFGPQMMDYAQDIMTFWIYDSGLMFAFTSYAGFGKARIPPADRQMVDAHIESQPARWDNLGELRPDSMVVRTARFRATKDSVDMYVAALPPTDAIRESTPSHLVRGDMWLMAGNGRISFHSAAVLETSGVHAWSARVPAGTYLFRVEATGADAKRSARASGQLQSSGDFPMSGAGMSDVLVASSASDAAAPGTRWKDLSIVPNAGAVSRGAPISLVWENYDLGLRSGSANYDVSVSIIPQKSSAGKIVAAITGALASVARVETRDDRAVIRYSRTVAGAPVIAEVMSVNLGETPAGTYTLTIEVTDKATGAKFARSVELLVRE
jgi:GWxTD domain-containing protein